MKMEKTYQPHAIEKQLYERWEKAGYFKASGNGQAYCIMIPPPNVTGSLHMGHGFQNTLMDILIRYHRMNGCDTHWQMGTDHAGIATQMVVERRLASENLPSRHELGRDAFVDKVWEWKNQSGGRIGHQLKRLGCSLDWDKERFTMDEGLSQAVQQVFIELYQAGLIYRGKRLVNWDPKFRTAISDLEVIAEEVDGFLWHIAYTLADNSAQVVIATTRPETLLGDTAIAVHPDDQRYQHLIGQKVRVPLTERLIPIIADEYVDPEFGSGCVKITPAHDFNDYKIGEKHQLPSITVLTLDGTMNHDEAVPMVYRDLEVFAARKKIVEDLKIHGQLVKVEPYRHTVPKGDRSGAVIEPMLTDQWFVKAKPLAEQAYKCVEEGAIEFVPANWQKIYFQWLDNIEDWCISRQLWWGHRIPAWYDEQGKVYVGTSEKAIRHHYQLSAKVILTQDEDVLDTWFSSALWPFSTLGWPEKTPELERYYPTDVLVTGFDIIFFWVARMVMFGKYFTQTVPFKKVYITGLIRDQEGQKMSKSKGNVLDPLDLIDGIDLASLITKRTQGLMQPHLANQIEKNTRQQFPEGIPAFGTDALRFTFCALATHGRDIRFDLERLAGYRNFCNKLWNAARFVLIHLDNKAIPVSPSKNSADQWILSELQHTIQKAHENIANYRFDLLAQCLYDFTWNIFCDWYLELAKLKLKNETPVEEREATQGTLRFVLEKLILLLHPVIPFITEAIWQQMNPEAVSLMVSAYPVIKDQSYDPTATLQIQWLQSIVTELRRFRNENNLPVNKKFTLQVIAGSDQDKTWLTFFDFYLIQLAKLTNIQWVDTVPDNLATINIGTLKLILVVDIDVATEKKRLTKELEHLTQELRYTEAKLTNQGFLSQAPKAIVAKQQQREIELKHRINELKVQFNKL